MRQTHLKLSGVRTPAVEAGTGEGEGEAAEGAVSMSEVAGLGVDLWQRAGWVGEQEIER